MERTSEHPKTVREWKKAGKTLELFTPTLELRVVHECYSVVLLASARCLHTGQSSSCPASKGGCDA